MGRARPQSGTPLMNQQQKLNLSHGASQSTVAPPSTQSFTNPLGLPKLSLKQLLYILVMQGVGAALIDGGANFGIACAMYRTTTDRISFWNIKHNTVAGDMAVTVFIQGILTFLISSSLIHGDMRNGIIAPFPSSWPAQSYSPQLHRLDRVRRVFSGSSHNDLFDFSVGAKVWFRRLAWSIWQGAVISACYFCLVWPIAIAILAPRYGKSNLLHTWVPPTIKCVYGAVLGLLQTPLIACIALGGEDAVRAGRLRQEASQAGQMEEATVGRRVAVVEPTIAPLSPAHVV